MSASCFRPERPVHASPGQRPGLAVPPIVSSPERAGQPSAPATPAPLCRPFRAGVLSAGSPRALPWADIFRPVGATVSAPVLAGHYGFTAEELAFILNYDLKYRLGRSPEAEEE